MSLDGSYKKSHLLKSGDLKWIGRDREVYIMITWQLSRKENKNNLIFFQMSVQDEYIYHMMLDNFCSPTS